MTSGPIYTNLMFVADATDNGHGEKLNEKPHFQGGEKYVFCK